jgi:hypothetical protein
MMVNQEYFIKNLVVVETILIFFFVINLKLTYSHHIFFNNFHHNYPIFIISSFNYFYFIILYSYLYFIPIITFFIYFISNYLLHCLFMMDYDLFVVIRVKSFVRKLYFDRLLLRLGLVCFFVNSLAFRWYWKVIY